MSPTVPFWIWSMAVIVGVGFAAMMLRSGTFRQGWMIAAIPVGMCLLWPVAYGIAHSSDPLTAYDIETGPCPGVVDYKEIRETGRMSVKDITAAFILNGWENITVEERGNDGFWSSTYSLVSAHCNKQEGSA